MTNFSINNFVLDGDVDVISTIYAVAPSMSNLDQEQPQQNYVYNPKLYNVSI
mgnify:CR=1 FL=1